MVKLIRGIPVFHGPEDLKQIDRHRKEEPHRQQCRRRDFGRFGSVYTFCLNPVYFFLAGVVETKVV
jgi:hypothetical protein